MVLIMVLIEVFVALLYRRSLATIFTLSCLFSAVFLNDCLKPELSVHLSDCNFVVQRLLLGLGILTSQLRCYVHSVVCDTCVGLRFDMPLIKRILID